MTSMPTSTLTWLATYPSCMGLNAKTHRRLVSEPTQSISCGPCKFSQKARRSLTFVSLRIILCHSWRREEACLRLENRSRIINGLASSSRSSGSSLESHPGGEALRFAIVVPSGSSLGVQCISLAIDVKNFFGAFEWTRDEAPIFLDYSNANVAT